MVCDCETSTFPAGSDAQVRHGARPSIGKVRFDHACLSAISFGLFLYLLQRQEEEVVSGVDDEDECII